MYLIPRSASPVSLEDRPEESLNRDELLRRQKARQDEQAAIKKKLKRERTEDNDSDDDLMMISSNRYANSFRWLIGLIEHCRRHYRKRTRFALPAWRARDTFSQHDTHNFVSV
ncbi:hypothetical protein D6D03_04926 [Aureobasidium pullulans]|nr:hypothetical protein D6D03_04926 [Aureobasidium pullulans]